MPSKGGGGKGKERENNKHNTKDIRDKKLYSCSKACAAVIRFRGSYLQTQSFGEKTDDQYIFLMTKVRHYHI